MRRATLIPALLLLICTLHAQPTLPPVYLNHVTITVSPETYRSIAASVFLRDDFASVEERLTRIEGRESVNGVYLYGRDTFVEFLASDDQTPAGALGFSMGIEDRHQLPRLQRALAAQLQVPLQIASRHCQLDRTWTPWFDFIRGDWMPPGPVTFSIMAYHPSYVADRSRGVNRSLVSSVRAQALARQQQPNRLLGDVRRLVLWSEPAEIQSMMQSLAALGYQRSSDGPVQTLRGPDIEFVFVPLEPQETRKFEIYFALAHPYDGPLAYRFPDNSTLTFFSKIARWSFPGHIKPAKPPSALAAKTP